MALTNENLGFKSSKDEADSGSNSLERRLGCGVHRRLLVGWSRQGIPKVEQDKFRWEVAKSHTLLQEAGCFGVGVSRAGC